MIIDTALKNGYQFLKKNNIKSYKIDTEILLSHILKKKRENIILNSNKTVETDTYSKYMSLIKLRSYKKPIAQIINIKNFWKDEFFINDKVLIPRPDTEILVEETLKELRNKKFGKILDIGVGSGCLLLSVLKEKKKFIGAGIDISKNALQICKINTKRLNLKKRVKYFNSDIDKFYHGKYDVIVSNPPYISRFDLKNLDKDVECYEPNLALDGGHDGLLQIKKVVNKASKLLKINGKLILEIGYDQKFGVSRFLKNKGFYIKRHVKDYARNDRCIVSIKIN